MFCEYESFLRGHKRFQGSLEDKGEGHLYIQVITGSSYSVIRIALVISGLNFRDYFQRSGLASGGI